MKSLKAELKFLFTALVLAGSFVANTSLYALQNSQPDDDPEWMKDYVWDDVTPPKDFDPEAFVAQHPEMNAPSDLPAPGEFEKILQQQMGEDFPLNVKKMLADIRQGGGKPVNPFSSGNPEALLDVQETYEALKASLAEDQKARQEKVKRGVISTAPDGSIYLNVFKGFQGMLPVDVSEAVNAAASLNHSPIALSAHEAELLQEEVERLTERALRITREDLDERKLKGISSLTPEKRFLVQMDRDQFQDPPKEVRDHLKEAGKLHELDSHLHGEFTGIEKTPIARLVLPHRDEVFMLIDTSFTDQYSPHMLLLIARQLQRAKSGQGRPVVLMLYSPASKGQPAKLKAEVINKPEGFINNVLTTKTAAMMPPTRNEVAWSALYTSYMVVCWYLTKFITKSSELPSGPANFEDFLRYAGEMGTFISKYSAGIESHIFYSALIGLCYSAYTYLIFDKNVPAWRQTIRHLLYISMPAGLWTLAQVNNWGMTDLFFSAAGLMAISHTLVNSLINNVSRSFSHSVFAARDGHRVGMGEVPFAGFRFKRQQFFREMLTFPLLFMTKIAHLLKLQPEAWTVRNAAGEVIGYSTPMVKSIPLVGPYLNSLSVGELAFYSLPAIAFSGALTYFLVKDDGVNYSEDRKKLLRDAWTFIKAPVAVPYRFGKWSCKKMIGALKQFKASDLRNENDYSQFLH